jgi:hypothetical protein
MTIRIAMWSGPRNISTAMMRSWENRPDCSVVDEPFYACYLHATQHPHPMFNEVLASQSINYDEVAKNLSEGPCNSPIQYQKHMTQHMLDNCDLNWTKNIRHCMLIRDPAYVVNSYTNSRGKCSAEDIGIKRQFELYEAISKLTGQKIPIVDSTTVLNCPEQIIPEMCAALNVECNEGTKKSMLNWPAGSRESDGVWAEHWYHSVEKSTGFGEAKKQSFTLTPSQMAVVDEVMPYYEKMKAKAIILFA